MTGWKWLPARAFFIPGESHEVPKSKEHSFKMVLGTGGRLPPALPVREPAPEQCVGRYFVQRAFSLGSLKADSRAKLEGTRMFRMILTLLLALVSGSIFLSAPAAAGAPVSRADGSFVLASGYEGDWRHRWNDRTCCQRNERGGYRIFWSTFGECYRSHGEPTTNKACRKNGGFHPYPGRSWQHDGWRDGDMNERWCCTRGGQVWWSTRGECLRAGGRQTANRVCRRN
jgi:hypothetical protein